MISRTDIERIAEVNAELAVDVLWGEVERARKIAETWYNAAHEKDANHAGNISYYRKHNDDLWQYMNETRHLLGRLRTRAASGENLSVPLENELHRLYNILKKAKKGERH